MKKGTEMKENRATKIEEYGAGDSEKSRSPGRIALFRTYISMSRLREWFARAPGET